MLAIERALEERLAPQGVPLAVVLPGGRRIGSAEAPVTLRLHELAPLAHVATGQIGRVAQDYVEGRLDIDGSMRDLMHVAALIVGTDPVAPEKAALPILWWRGIVRAARSRARHQAHADAEQIQFHYDVSDAFYDLWLDERKVYSCAYWRDAHMTLEGAQAAKLDHICKKLMLREGERFLDIGAGWGGLLLWAAEHYGVRADGITLSKNQHAHVNRLIDERGLRGRVTMELRDYRDLSEGEPYDSVASVGMFEHVGQAQLPVYFNKIRRLLKPGGLLMNHGITAGGTRNDQLGAGIGDFIERYIFPGGELMHVSHVLKVMSEAGLEPLDAENLRPHYASTLWAWSDRLEAQLAQARAVTRESVVRAYRLYLAGSAMSFEQGWISLFQMLASRPSGDVGAGPMRGAQSRFPFNRGYIYK
ncbi:MAG TPA: cyclopropane-fatty-acyl-phospholipid synthase family protein [Rhizobacter sp.]|nr:cyclopropane-fatty-acyl-phospholipid synthase family protein [Rhizobacter sp.]